MDEVKNIRIYQNRMMDFLATDRNYFKFDVTLKSVTTRTNNNNDKQLDVSLFFYNENVCNVGVIDKIENQHVTKEVYLVDISNESIIKISRLTRNRGARLNNHALPLLMEYIKNELPNVQVKYVGEVS